MNQFIAIIKGMYVIRLEKKTQWKRDHMVMNTFLQIVKYSVFITVLIGCWMITSPAVKSLVDYGMDNFTTYSDRIDSLSKSVENAKNEITAAFLESVKTKKNPGLDGIIVENLPDLLSVYPAEYNVNDKKWMINKLQDWAVSEDYDGVIFGSSYVGLNGTVCWCDGNNSKYDTDMELIINTMKKKGCKKIFSFVENMPEHRIFPQIVKNYITGYLTVGEYQKYRFKIWGYNFIKTDTPKTIKTKNFNIEIVGSDITTLMQPYGFGNETVMYDHPDIPLSKQVKDTINGVTGLF